MREAAELAQTDAKAAIAAYDKIAADGAVGPVLQDLAALRAGALLIDAAPCKRRDAARAACGDDRTFRHTAREFLVLAAWRARRYGGGQALDRHDHDRSADAAGTRSRVEMLVALAPATARVEVRSMSRLHASVSPLLRCRSASRSRVRRLRSDRPIVRLGFFQHQEEAARRTPAGVPGGHARCAAGRAHGVGQGLSGTEQAEQTEPAQPTRRQRRRAQAESEAQTQAEAENRSQAARRRRKTNRDRPPSRFGRHKRNLRHKRNRRPAQSQAPMA